jgi:HAD superfamily hydrolase (TIGR01458 family)
MPDRPAPPTDLRAALHGVRALLLDLDGVIALAGKPVDGAPGALVDLDRRGIPFRIVTNTSLVSRATLAGWGARMGAPVAAERFQSALSASAAYTARAYPGQALYVLGSDDALTEFDGQHLLSHEAASAPDARVAAVVVGDSPEALTYDNVNRAFRLVRGGAELIGMHRNPWWLTPEGPTVDAGAYVVGLEFATGVAARIAGKPSRTCYGEGVLALRREVRAAGGPALHRHEIAMVGDDVRTDVRAAQRAGLRGVFVLSGKHGPADIEAAATERGGRRPDAIATSLAEVVAALD